MDLNFSKNKKTTLTPVKWKFRMTPVGVWHLLLVGFFVLFAITVGYSYWVFYRVSHFSTSGSAAAATVSKGSIDIKKLNTVLNNFADRAAIFEKTKLIKPDVVNPNQ